MSPVGQYAVFTGMFHRSQCNRQNLGRHIYLGPSSLGSSGQPSTCTPSGALRMVCCSGTIQPDTFLKLFVYHKLTFFLIFVSIYMELQSISLCLWLMNSPSSSIKLLLGLLQKTYTFGQILYSSSISALRFFSQPHRPGELKWAITP